MRSCRVNKYVATICSFGPSALVLSLDIKQLFRLEAHPRRVKGKRRFQNSPNLYDQRQISISLWGWLNCHWFRLAAARDDCMQPGISSAHVRK